MGSLYLRGKTWWMKIYIDGRPVQKSTGTTKKMVAKEVLKAEERKLDDEKIPGFIRTDHVYEDMERLFLHDYRVNGMKSERRAVISAGHLSAFFNGRKIREVTSTDIQAYIGHRIEAGSANATINRELAALKRMFALGYEQSPPMVLRVPRISMLAERNTRAGFFEHGDFLRVRDALPPHLRPVVTFAYKTGWRLEEILSLKWSQVDRIGGSARIDDSKNGDARTVYFDSELRGVISDLWVGKRVKGLFCEFVFVNRAGDGRMLRFDKAWKRACSDAGVDRIFHDLRRTAVRNMVRSGVPEGVAMKITGHRTRSVFERYNIVSDQDLINAASRYEAHLEEKTATVTDLATVRLKTAKAG